MLLHDFSLCCAETTAKQTKNQLITKEKKILLILESIIAAGTHLSLGGLGFSPVFQKNKRVKMEFNDGRFSNPFLFSSRPGPWVYEGEFNISNWDKNWNKKHNQK